MNNTILVAVLVGALSGTGGALVARALVPADSAPERTSASEGLSPGDTSDDTALLEALEALRLQNDDLALRLAALERSDRSSVREDLGAAPTEDLAAIQKQVTDLAAALQNPQSAEAASLRSSVRVAMDQIREEESAERDRERADRNIERIDERLTELQTELGLDQVQMKSMREVMLVQTDKRSALFASMRDGSMDRGEIREQMGVLRDETNASLQGILTPMQYEDYEKLEGDRGFGGFGGGRGGRGGRGDGGGGGGGGGGRGRN